MQGLDGLNVDGVDVHVLVGPVGNLRTVGVFSFGGFEECVVITFLIHTSGVREAPLAVGPEPQFLALLLVAEDGPVAFHSISLFVAACQVRVAALDGEGLYVRRRAFGAEGQRHVAALRPLLLEVEVPALRIIRLAGLAAGLLADAPILWGALVEVEAVRRAVISSAAALALLRFEGVSATGRWGVRGGGGEGGYRGDERSHRGSVRGREAAFLTRRRVRGRAAGSHSRRWR